MQRKKKSLKSPTSPATDEVKSNHRPEPTPIAEPQLLEELKAPPVERNSEPIPAELIKKEAKQRAKDKPLIQKILQVFQKEKSTFKELIINTEPLERRVALLTDGVLEKFEVERTGELRMVGAIFKGHIQNLEPGLKAAFVDIGEDKNAFLHYWDILPAATDSSIEIIRENQSEESRKKKEAITIQDIPKLYPIGKEIVVQITKSQIGSKGPRTTTNISLPGRFLVLTPNSPQCGISRKIEDRKERERLKTILKNLTIPDSMGIILRTAGEGKKLRYFIRDLHLLLKKWENICNKQASTNKPILLDQEPDLLERTVRDFLTEDIDRIMVDTQDDFNTITALIEEISPRSKSKISLFKETIPIFERFNIERQIEQTFMRKVPLPSGGEIVIEETEALTAVDVNTGSHKGSKDGKDYIVNANLEAAVEIARQIRLRNIGGLLIFDFIDMKNRKDRNAVYDCMRREMAKDKAKTHILPISQLGIMQMTRQRHQESTSSGMYSSCPYCQGRGIVKSVRSMSVEIQRKLTSILRNQRRRESTDEPIKLRILLHPLILERLRSEDEKLLIDIENLYKATLSFRADPAFHLENFKIIDPVTGQELA